MVPPGNKAKRLSSVNHFAKTIRHRDWYFGKSFLSSNAKQQVNNGIKSLSKLRLPCTPLFRSKNFFHDSPTICRGRTTGRGCIFNIFPTTQGTELQLQIQVIYSRVF